MTPELKMLMALKAAQVSLIEDEYYANFKPLLKTIKEAIDSYESSLAK